MKYSTYKLKTRFKNLARVPKLIGDFIGSAFIIAILVVTLPIMLPIYFLEFLVTKVMKLYRKKTNKIYGLEQNLNRAYKDISEKGNMFLSVDSIGLDYGGLHNDILNPNSVNLHGFVRNCNNEYLQYEDICQLLLDKLKKNKELRFSKLTPAWKRYFFSSYADSSEDLEELMTHLQDKDIWFIREGSMAELDYIGLEDE